MTSRPNSDVDPGQPARLTLSQVTDSLLTQQPHHCLSPGTCVSRITCDRPLGPFPYNWIHRTKILNARVSPNSALLWFSSGVRGTFEYVELVCPALNDTQFLYIFSSYNMLLLAFSICILARQ